jgi:DMSO/TMAO reductase YedYZ molybdopterin-dependent catalytic subunit
MSQRETEARDTGRRQPARREAGLRAGGGPACQGDPEDAGRLALGGGPLRGSAPGRRLPPGQYVPAGWPVLHYGPVPVFNPETWDLRVVGATESGQEHRWNWAQLAELPRTRIVADFHCVTKFSIQDAAWDGIAAADLLRAVPPAPAVTHVMTWADFGYSANVRIADFLAEDTILATHLDGAELSPEHGYPLRLVVPSRYGWKSVKWVRAVEYLTKDRRGFWEERGYHNTADPWREQRYSYQEQPGDGPAS